MNIELYLAAFEKVYQAENAKNLLSKRWRQENDLTNAPPSTGFCYIAAEALFHILIDHNPKAFCASYEDENGIKCTHWWLEINGVIVDPTKSQYTDLGEIPPYHLGKGKGFLTKKISKRAAKLMGMVLSI